MVDGTVLASTLNKVFQQSVHSTCLRTWRIKVTCCNISYKRVKYRTRTMNLLITTGRFCTGELERSTIFHPLADLDGIARIPNRELNPAI